MKIISVVRDFEMYNRLVKDNPFNKGAEFICFNNNEENLSISKRYNSFLNGYDYDNEDWFVFCHEDWEVKENLQSRLNEIDKDCLYGPIGANWRYSVKEAIGCITHCNKDGSNEEKAGLKNYNLKPASTFDCQCLISNHDCVFPEKHTWETLQQPFDYHQILIGLSDTYEADMYYQYKQYLKRNDKKTFICNMFVLKRDDFFAYCEKIFGILFSLHNTENLIKSDKYKNYINSMLDNDRVAPLAKLCLSNNGLILLPRIYGYIAEILSSFFFSKLIDCGANPLTLPFENIVSKKIEKIKYIPSWLISKKSGVKSTKYKLFNIFTLLKIKHKSNKDVYKLFGFITLFKKELDEWRLLNKHNNTVNVNGFDINKVSVGKYSYGNLRVQTVSRSNEKLIIGNYVSIGPDVNFILASEHPYKRVSTFPFKTYFMKQYREAASKGDIIVDDDVWIGLGAIINSGVHIGQGAIIASGAVVVKDVEPYSIVGGNPAKHLKYRFDESIRKKLIKIKFSDLTENKIRENIDYLYENLSEDNVDSIINKIF